MEKWQERHITKNLPALLFQTTCNPVLLATLKAGGELSQVDVETIKSRIKGSEQNELLYNILVTRKNGYGLLAKALADCCQTGAFTVLMEGFAKNILSQLIALENTQILADAVKKRKVELDVAVESYFETDEGRELLKKVTGHLTIDAYKKLCPDAKSDLKLVKNTIPKQTGKYFNRTLSKRALLNPSIFTATCNDIFVFKNIYPSELNKLIKSQKYVPSKSVVFGKSLDHKSCRFMLLDEPMDWEEISRDLVQGAKIPAHLINFDRHTGTCILEETTGGSDILYQYVTRKQGPLHKEESKKFVIPEEEFLSNIPEYEQPFAGYCICDSPGMGKTTLLASLAWQAKKILPNHIVAFFPLAFLTEKMGYGQVGQEASSVPSSVEIVLEHLATCKEAKLILNELFAEKLLHMELFLDGLDEVPLKHLSATLQLLTDLATKLPNTKIYVASRPHLRKELESKLRVVSYDILPFSHSNKIDYLVAFWKDKIIIGDESKLTEFADFCLKEYESRCTFDEREITGIPMQCRLVAEVSAKMARRHALSKNNLAPRDSCKFDYSLGQLYKDFMEESFQKVCSGKEIKDCKEMQAVKNYHIWIALRTTFPEIAQQFARHSQAVTNMTELTYSTGLLETRLNGSGETVELVHRTFAEYLTAEFFANALTGQIESYKITDSCIRNFKMEMVQFIIQNIFLDNTAEDLHYPRRINYPVVTYFLDFILPDDENSLCSNNYQLDVLYSALYTMRTPEIMLVRSIKYPYIRRLVESYRTAWHSKNAREFISMETTLSQVEEAGLFAALIRADVAMVKSIVDDSVDSGEWKRLISVCVFNSIVNGLEEAERRKEICQFLLNKTRNAEELDTEEEFVGIHLVLAKFLITNGASPISPAWKGNALCDAVKYMNSDDLHEICWFLVQNRPQVYTVKRAEWRSALHHILLKREDAKTETIEAILNIPETRDDAEHSQYINSLLLTALSTKQRKEILETIIKHHPHSRELLEKVETATNIVDLLPLLSIDSSTVDEHENSFLHICSMRYSPDEYHELVQYLSDNLSDKTIFTNGNSRSKLPVHLAVEHMELKKQTLKLFQSGGVCLDSVDSKGFSLLMCAANAKRSLSCLQSLIEMGVDMNMHDWLHRYTFPRLVLENYSAEDFHEIVEMLLETCGHEKLKMSIEKEFDRPEHFLLYAICNLELSPKTVHLLVENGLGSLSAFTDHGSSVLHFAVNEKRSLELVKFLVGQGADWNVKCNRDNNLTHLSAEHGLIEHLRYFVSLGCDINERDDDGDNALQTAVQLCPTEKLLPIVNFLVESDADKANVNSKGKTAHDLALELGVTDRRILDAIE